MTEKRKIQGSKFDPQYSFMVVHTCTLRLRCPGKVDFLGLAGWPACLVSSVSFRLENNPVSETKCTGEVVGRE